MGNIYQLLSGMCTGSNPVLAVVTAATGSTPQKPGSAAVFGREGLLHGTVGGGLTEGRVSEYASECLITGKSAHLTFNLDNEVAEKTEAICGGVLTVLVDAKPMNHLALFKEVDKAMRERLRGVLITVITPYDGIHVMINRHWVVSEAEVPEPCRQTLAPIVDNLLRSEKQEGFISTRLTDADDEGASTAFLELLSPQPHLVIAGAGHIGRALSHLGSLLGFYVTVADNRSEYANNKNLPDADAVVVEEIGGALGRIQKNKDTYIVIVTRGHADDAEALKQCIGSDAGYVGMIGSRPKIAKMKNEFIENKWATEEQWSAIHTPIGLEINSKTVQEIAVSIAAQLVKVRNSMLT